MPATPTVRKIIHFDADCFYAAVEMRDDPSLRGKTDRRRRNHGATRRDCDLQLRSARIRCAFGTADPSRAGVVSAVDFACRTFHATARHRRRFSAFTAIIPELIEPLSLDEAVCGCEHLLCASRQRDADRSCDSCAGTRGSRHFDGFSRCRAE